MPSYGDFLGDLDYARKCVKGVGGKQINSIEAKSAMRMVAQDYFATLRPAVMAAGATVEELKPTDAIFKEVSELSHRSPLKAKCDKLLRDGRAKLVKLEASSLGREMTSAGPNVSKDDDLIIATLTETCPAAADAYQQGLKDLISGGRVSWRGPASELREALRETLDHLAPDGDVMATPIYKKETGKTRPTMKEKARYILRMREVPSGQGLTLEDAVDGVENVVSSMTRSVYTRTSVSAHRPTTQQEVIRIHHWVRLSLCDLLGLTLSI